MHKILRKMRRVRFDWAFSRRYSSKCTSPTELVKYPEILDLSPEAVKRRARQKRAEKIEALNTVEEKLFAINLEKYYGWNSLIIKEGSYPYDFLPFAKHTTRTLLNRVTKPTFHKVIQTLDSEHKELLTRIRPYLQEAILFELKGRRKRENIELTRSDGELQDEISKSVLTRINEILLSSLSTQYPHLLECMVDYDPRVEAFWSVGNFHPSDELYNIRDKDENKKVDKSERVEHWIQYFGKPVVQLRSSLPLPVLDTEHISEYNNQKDLIPAVNYDPPLLYGLNFERRNGTNIPGFWPGDKLEYGTISYHVKGHLVDRPPNFEEQEHKDTLDCQAIFAGFSWTHAQACYHGFSTYSDVTYPFVSQNIISDGKSFSFYLYQLNTTLLHSDLTITNPRLNICLSLPECQLYKAIDKNEFIGWDDSVLSTLISCYLNEPKVREGIQLKPYVNPAESHIANIEEEEKRIWLHDKFRYMYSNRPRSRLPYEIYDWERIYKIKFETRALEARSRPFERDENPMEERKYYEHVPQYIPKKFRSRKKHWTGWRSKFEKTFYPDV